MFSTFAGFVGIRAGASVSPDLRASILFRSKLNPFFFFGYYFAVHQPGLVYGILTLKSGQVAPAIFAHTASNALAALYWKNFMADSQENLNIEINQQPLPNQLDSEETSR